MEGSSSGRWFCRLLATVLSFVFSRRLAWPGKTRIRVVRIRWGGENLKNKLSVSRAPICALPPRSLLLWQFFTVTAFFFPFDHCRAPLPRVFGAACLQYATRWCLFFFVNRHLHCAFSPSCLNFPEPDHHLPRSRTHIHEGASRLAATIFSVALCSATMNVRLTGRCAR